MDTSETQEQDKGKKMSKIVCVLNHHTLILFVSDEDSLIVSI